MAAVSATFVRLCSSLRPPASLSNQCAKAFSLKSVSFSTAKVNVPSLRSSRFGVVCAAKPETVSKVMGIVKEQLALTDEIALTPESTFSALGADSLDTVEIVMQLEETFDISIEEDNSQNIATVQDAADLIEKLVENKSEAA